MCSHFTGSTVNDQGGYGFLRDAKVERYRFPQIMIDCTPRWKRVLDLLGACADADAAPRLLKGNGIVFEAVSCFASSATPAGCLALWLPSSLM